MKLNLSLNQQAAPENRLPKKEMDCARFLGLIPILHRVKCIPNIDGILGAKLFVAVLAGGMMLGNAFGAEAPVQLPESASALLNRGNEFVREGRAGHAILAYERAQQLAPRDPAISVNLRAVRDTAGLAVPKVVWWQSFAAVLTMNEWAWSGCLALAFICGAAFLGRLLPKRLRQTAKMLSAACALAVLTSVVSLWLRWPELSQAVVINSHVAAQIAPAESAETAFPLAEGEIVTAKKALRNYVLVRAADGRAGWVGRSQIERIIPDLAPDRAG